MADQLQWPFQAKTRYLRIAIEHWYLIKKAIEQAQIQCKKEGQVIEEHFEHFLDENHTEDYRLSRYGCLLTEQYLYRSFEIDTFAQTKDIDIT